MSHTETEFLSRDDLLQRLDELERENLELRARLQEKEVGSEGADTRMRNEALQRADTAASERHAQEIAAAGLQIVELQQSRNSLQTSEGWLRALVESATDYAIITLDLHGRVTSWNSGARNILGWEEHEVIGRHTGFFFTPEDREKGAPEREMQGALAEGRAEDRRWHLRKDGVRLWCNGVLMPFRDSELLGFLKILRDRTKERHAEQQLRENEERLRDIMESISDAFYSLDAQLRFIYVNRRAAEIWGKRVEDLIGRTFTDVFPEFVGSEQWGFHERVRATNEPLQAETRSAITGRWLSVSYYPVAQGGLTVYFRDITERKRTEEALSASHERILEILESISDAFYAVDREWRFTYVNRKAEEWWGRKREDLIGKVYPDVFPQVVDTRAFQAHIRAMNERKPIHFEALSPILHHWVDINIYPTADGGLSVYFRDITERKKADEHQRVLIHELNHRVKNTLATVQSIATQTLRNAPTMQDAKEALENRLFALSRAHDVLTRESWEAASLHEIVTQAIEPYHNHEEGRILFSGPDVRIPPRTALALAMAFQELATNAAKYGALFNETGRVRIHWTIDDTQTPPCLRLRWEETGGPPVREPERRGFGTRLIERSVAHDLNGSAKITFAPTGVVCEITSPLGTEHETPPV